MENYWEDFDEEQSLDEIKNLEDMVKDLEEMYQHSLELIRLDNDAFDLDFDLKSLRDTIDNRIVDCKEVIENIEQHIEMLQDNQNDFLDYEYRHNKIDY